MYDTDVAAKIEERVQAAIDPNPIRPDHVHVWAAQVLTATGWDSAPTIYLRPLPISDLSGWVDPDTSAIWIDPGSATPDGAKRSGYRDAE